MKTLKFASGSIFVAALLVAESAFAQKDPGVQAGSRGTGAALPSVLADEPAGILAFFKDGQKRFQDVEVVSNSPTGNNGLGPRFNSNSCVSCHGQPGVGGTVPVRIIIDKEGRVRHVHLLNAFPDQARAIMDGLKQWRFRPYLRDGQPVEVETGMMFGRAR